MDRPDRLGPPVDSARLQPNNQADDTPQVDDGLVGRWLDDPDLAAELADQEEHFQRLQADDELLLALQLNGFAGPQWDRFTRELARYGLGVLRAWILRGNIYGKVQSLTGYGLSRLDGWPDRQTAEDLAAETVVVALNYFRDNVLKAHRWQSAGGASLSTFFIGQCLHQFANLYRRAFRSERERIEHAVTPMAELPEHSFEVIKGIEETIVGRNSVAEAMNQLTSTRARKALFLREIGGYTHREIADQLGLPNAKSVENLIGYQHTLIRRRNAQRTS